MTGLESVPLIGKKLVELISYLKKHFSLRERETNISKKEKELREKENEIKELIDIKKDNIAQIANLIKIDIPRFTPALKAPRLEFDVRISNRSIFDLKLTKFKYDIDFVEGVSHYHVIKNGYYREEAQIPRQAEISFSHTCDPPSGLIGEIINRIKDMSSDSETQWDFLIQCEFEGPEAIKFRKDYAIPAYKPRSWIIRVLGI